MHCASKPFYPQRGPQRRYGLVNRALKAGELIRLTRGSYLLADRYRDYSGHSFALAQAIREILQEVALYSLWRAGFFEIAAFQAGTSLRILHGLPRFSEDLDFILKAPDWYDFNWYVKQHIHPNYAHLQAALDQHGPWQGQALMVDQNWLKNALVNKIATIDWAKAAEDVTRFLNPAEQHSLTLWNGRFFKHKVEKI